MRLQEKYILSKLSEREEKNNLRSLRNFKNAIDFCSNDYLGLSASHVIKTNWIARLSESDLGSTGSRLLNGNNDLINELESTISAFHQAEDALIFNSGWDANYGLLSALPYKGDTILCDEFVHASIIDGIKASKAESQFFKHNSLEHLEEKLLNCNGLKYVVVESLYSMDGDFAPLKEMAQLCKKHEAALIVDEAHASGIYGKYGEGLVVASELQNDVFARVITFSKAFGAHGAAVVGSKKLKQFLLNFSRPQIFTTALPFYVLSHLQIVYKFLPTIQHERNLLYQNIQQFKQTVLASLPDNILLNASSSNLSPIQIVIISGNDQAKKTASYLQENGLDVRAILAPTVPKGMERLRICLHSFNTEKEINSLVKKIAETILI